MHNHFYPFPTFVEFIRKSLLAFLLLLLVSACRQQDQISERYKWNVSAQELEEHVRQLASDEMEGRGAGYTGEKKAAEYIAEQMRSNGLSSILKDSEGSPSYVQPFDFHTLGSALPWERLNTQNVIGMLKGLTLPEEYIVLGGHHDGQGMPGQADFGRDIDAMVTDSLAATQDSIWNSAVDNAVSVAAILEIARKLKENNIKLKRSVIFSTFSAEESGLDGSTHFANHPPCDLGQIKAMINLEQLVGDPEADFLYVSYASNPIFEQLQVTTDSLHQLKLVPFYPGIIANTDHYAFLQRRIPAITMGTGSQINVHSPLDHADRLDYDLLQRRTEYILSYLIQLANAEGSFDFQGDLSGLLGVSGGHATAAEKEERGFDGEVGFKVTTVVKGSKGYLANIAPGDLIIAVEDKPIAYQTFYQGLEDVIGETELKKVRLKVLRAEEELEITVDMD